MLRQIFLDTETTGLETRDGHRIIEIGCVEMIDRKLTNNNYHQYIKPDRESDEEALAVHGITTEFLSDKPRFNEIAADFLNYVKGAELIIHNAPFDIGFLNYELSLLGAEVVRGVQDLATICEISDSLVQARELHPGQRNSLDALCKRYDISNDHRQLHGALLDSEILADVYLAMTGGQTALLLGEEGSVEIFYLGVDRQRKYLEKDNVVVGSVTIAKGSVDKSFTTKNILSEYEQIEMTLVDGACKVSLDLEYEFSSKILSMVVGPVFNQVANTMVDSFVKQAKVLEQYPELDISAMKVGLFGKLTTMKQKVRDKDRIEIYRPLIADPKEVRKKRAAEGKALKKGGGDAKSEKASNT
ncbi:DNA polymerase III subunit epsilon [Nymphon striatum]|nr:DNA polymerase III subunit epsilon [Nymphon striatum]